MLMHSLEYGVTVLSQSCLQYLFNAVTLLCTLTVVRIPKRIEIKS